MTQTPVLMVPDDATLVRLADEAKTAQRAYCDAFMARYAIGKPVSWEYGGGVQHGKVVRHAVVGDRIKVGNDETGTSYWIHGSRVLAVLRTRPL